ncbi:hypothetical protein NQ318_010396 [Aromia moschata]|uniref:Uncharacterized protein n=1 Tax=Aromia moschata TaxID=1265417 RepID=A0AAV8Y6M9_9CUCU|nr:hypothetical protein NQ318_010396 [Aromia moschata]
MTTHLTRTPAEIHKYNEDSSFHLELANNPHSSPSSSESFIKESKNFENSTGSSDLRGYWQPKSKKSLAERLPKNMFHLIPPSRYIFPGARYSTIPTKLHYEGDSSSSDSSDSESETESPNVSF